MIKAINLQLQGVTAMKKSELLEQVRREISLAEWEALEQDMPVAISDFNRKTLLELRSASIENDTDIPEEWTTGLEKSLRAYLSEHMARQPEGWKWVILSSLYLAFIAERPMHPISQLGIKTTVADGGTLYECPAKSTLKNTVCDYCVCKRMSNYEITKRQMAQKFATYDQKEIIRRFHLDSSKEWIDIRFLTRPYQISRSSGTIYRIEHDVSTEAGFNEAMTIYDVLSRTAEDFTLSGEFVPISGLTKAANAPGKSGNLFLQETQLFDHKERELSRACEQLGGEKFGKGDVAYRLPLFDFLPVAIQFWSSDDEFPASLQLLWDQNTLRMMHYETVWYAAGFLLDSLAELVR